MDFLSNLFGGAKNLFGGMSGGLESMFGKNAQGQSNVNGPGLLGGLASFGMGQTVKQPQLGSFNTPQMQAYQNYQPGNINNLSPEARQALNYNLAPQEDQMRRQLRNTYAQAQPGADLANNGAYLRDYGYNEQNISNNRNSAYMGAVNQIDQQKMQQLGDMAQMSVQEIVAKYGISAQQAQQMKQMYGNIGGMFMTKGLYPNGMGNMNFGQPNQGNTQATAVQQAANPNQWNIAGGYGNDSNDWRKIFGIQ